MKKIFIILIIVSLTGCSTFVTVNTKTNSNKSKLPDSEKIYSPGVNSAMIVDVSYKLEGTPVITNDDVSSKILSKLTMSNVFKNIYSLKNFPHDKSDLYQIFVEIDQSENRHKAHNTILTTIVGLTLMLPPFSLSEFKQDMKLDVKIHITKSGKEIAVYKGQSKAWLKYNVWGQITEQHRKNKIRFDNEPFEAALSQAINQMIQEKDIFKKTNHP